MSVSRKDRIFEGKGSFEIKLNDPEAVFQLVTLGIGSEILSDSLVKELSGRGWPLDQLKIFQKRGFRYCRARDSIIEGR